jgi:hypothetical protein
VCLTRPLDGGVDSWGLHAANTKERLIQVVIVVFRRLKFMGVFEKKIKDRKKKQHRK